MTGEQLFLRHAFPCIDTGGGVIVGKKYRTISDEHLAELKKLIRNNGQPRRSLLRYCFPYAFRRLKEYAEANGLERWALATVADFWHNHHGHEGECRVRCCAVVEVDSDRRMTAVVCKGERFSAINLYRLPVQIGQVVYVHLRVIVEIEGMDI